MTASPATRATRTGERHSAEERRAEIVAAAMTAFASTGLEGTPAETIARAVGISQPYLFRLFGTKKGLFIAAVEACFAETVEAFEHASEGARDGSEAFERMGQAYHALIADRDKLRMQMQAYAACEDPEIRLVVQRGFGELVRVIGSHTGASPGQLAHFLAQGMLLNVMASMHVLGATSGWASLLREGCLDELP